MTDGNEGKSHMPENEETGDSFQANVKIPPFYTDNPALWFAQLEAQFTLFNITADIKKFHYVVVHLDRVCAVEVKDVIISPPDEDKYEKLKTELIKRLFASRQKKVKQLLMQAEVGDRKPSQLLRHLQNLAGLEVPEDFLRTIWISKLPAGIQKIVASQLSSGLEDLAELANRIHDVVTPTPQMTTSTAVPEPAMDQLAIQITELTKQIQMLTTKINRQSRSTDRSRSRSRYRSVSTRSRSNFRKFPACWYHYKFGDQARKCIKPCVYTTENS